MSTPGTSTSPTVTITSATCSLPRSPAGPPGLGIGGRD
jgi:hypothetical protein